MKMYKISWMYSISKQKIYKNLFIKFSNKSKNGVQLLVKYN